MTNSRRLILRSAWLGFALAGLFFYPLAAAIDSDPYYLQWQPAHVAETWAALLILTALFAGLVYCTWPRATRSGDVALALVVLVPFLSLGAGVSRQLPIDDALRDAWESPTIGYGVPAALALFGAAAFVLRPRGFGRGLRGAVSAASPISLVVVWSLLTSTQAVPAIAIERTPPPSTARCPSVLALLFDELSFAYLYDGTEVRPDFPQIRAFSGTATNHLRVRAPGDETLVSISGYLAGQAFDYIRVEGDHLDYERGTTRAVFKANAPDGLFATARRAGYSPEAVGYYFPYCDMLGSLVDACRSFSLYNVATANAGFSPLHPVMTTLILWPRQFPLGLLKNPPFARLQRALVEATYAFAVRPLPASRSAFRFVHFSVPHLPFVFGPDGYDPPFNPLRARPDTAYVAQVHYVDRLFGEVLAQLQRSGSLDRTTVVLFADHGFRSGGQEQNSRHIPFMVRTAGQRSRIDVTDDEGGERLLLDLVQMCTP